MNDNRSPNHKQNYTTLLTLVSSATANSSRRISGVTMITRVRHHFSNTFAQRPSVPDLFVCRSVLEWYWLVPHSGCFENESSPSDASSPVESSVSSLEINKASSVSEGAAILLNAHFCLDAHKSNKASSQKRAKEHGVCLSVLVLRYCRKLLNAAGIVVILDTIKWNLRGSTCST